MKTVQHLTTLQISYAYRRQYTLDIANRELTISKTSGGGKNSRETFDLNQLNWIDSNLSNKFRQGY